MLVTLTCADDVARSSDSLARSRSAEIAGVANSSKSFALLLLSLDNLAAGWQITAHSGGLATRESLLSFLHAGMPRALASSRLPGARAQVLQQTVSPFDPDTEDVVASTDGEDVPHVRPAKAVVTGPLELTRENVELVLDEMRPYLEADGGNVALVGIDDGVVKVELQGACETCPSSGTTMSMGLEKGLRKKIPDIVAVQQVVDGPAPTEEGIEAVLEEIRPFLKMSKSTIEILELQASSAQPTLRLAMTGPGSKINAVRTEIIQRLRRNFPALANIVYEST